MDSSKKFKRKSIFNFWKKLKSVDPPKLPPKDFFSKIKNSIVSDTLDENLYSKGVINEIHKLYYIGDWEDDYCDLTLNHFIKKFGKRGINKNNITVNIKL